MTQPSANFVPPVIDKLQRPWLCFPYPLISWWDMQQFSARAFYLIGITLEQVPLTVANLAEKDEFPTLYVDQQADETLIRLVKAKAKFIRELCAAIGLRSAGDQADRILWRTDYNITPNQILQFAEELKTRISDEMKGELFFHVSSETREFYEPEEPFGKGISVQIADVNFEMREACTCFALGRNSASVFHLMRVLERGLAVFGKVFGVSLEHTNWEPAIDQISSKIREMGKDPTWKSCPDWKTQQEFFAQASYYLRDVKNAWRNYTMHARGGYSEKETKALIEDVRPFMGKISERIPELGGTIVV